MTGVSLKNKRKVLAARPSFSESNFPDLLAEIESILRSGHLILGPYTKRFEDEFKAYVGTKYAVAVSTCSAALQIVLRYYEVSGREVIVPTSGFPGALSPIIFEGGTPVLTEMDAKTFCMDIDDALSRVTPKTAGFIVTHLAGRIQPDLDRLRTYCKENGLFLIEDASHAHGASIDGKKAGALADAACFSFYPTKIMTSLVGGMITTDNEELYDLARSLRHHGQGTQKNEFVHLASDWCMSEIHAAVGLSQLGDLDELVEIRNRVVARYRKNLSHYNWITFPEEVEGIVHSYYKLPVVLDKRIDHDTLRDELNTKWGVQNGMIYYPPCHLQPVHQKYFNGKPGMFPVAEDTLEQQFCPPVHASVSNDDIDYVCEALVKTVAKCWKDQE